jgi:hypothetical protein
VAFFGILVKSNTESNGTPTTLVLSALADAAIYRGQYNFPVDHENQSLAKP